MHCGKMIEHSSASKQSITFIWFQCSFQFFFRPQNILPTHWKKRSQISCNTECLDFCGWVFTKLHQNHVLFDHLPHRRRKEIPLCLVFSHHFNHRVKNVFGYLPFFSFLTYWVSIYISFIDCTIMLEFRMNECE